jgi:hypothetical protein
MSALGQKADICNAKRHVRFTPKSGRSKGVYQRCRFAQREAEKHDVERIFAAVREAR